ncbi:hypothetical protein D3C86_357800 [compost metagenome]
MDAEIRAFAGTYGALMGLLVLTAAGAYLPLGAFHVFLAYGVAIAKAGLIAWIFMELRESPMLARLVAGVGLFWLGILFVLSLSDFLTRGWLGFSAPIGP